MDAKYERQMKKGVLEMLVLHTVCQGQTYGYEICTRLDKQSGGLFAMKEGTLYPILYRLQDEGLIESRWSVPDGRGAAKKYYEATAAGQQTSKELIALWKSFGDNVDRIIFGGKDND